MNARRGEASDPVDRPCLLLTGATGFLGSHFLLRLAQRNCRVVAVVRGASAEAAKARVLAAMDEAARAYFQPPDPEAWAGVVEVYAGDVTQPDLGLSADDLASLRERRITAVWHFAGSLKYEQKHRAEIVLQNVEGTRHTADLAVTLGIPGFVHISTAFVAGCRTGEIPETLTPPGTTFNNVYEESKSESEHLVMGYRARGALQVRILRPGIVVGPLTTLATGGSDTGLYGFIAMLHRTKQALSGLDHRPVLIGDAATPAHLSPVDRFVDDAIHVMETGVTGSPIAHTLCDTALTAQDVVDAFAAEIGVPVFEMRAAYGRPASPIELVFDRVMGMYGVACRFPKRFTRSLPPQPSITVAQLRGYVFECLSETRRKKIAIPWVRSAVRSYDGSRLTSYSLGDRPAGGTPVVLVNAFGMGLDIWEGLVDRLGRDRRVLTWDSRGVPGLTEPFDEAQCDITAHAKDLDAVLAHHGVATAHLVGWCTGAQVILRFASLYPSKVASFASVNGAFSFQDGVPISDFKRNIMFLMPKVAASRAHASAYHQTLYGNVVPTTTASRDIQEDVERHRARVNDVLLASRDLIVNMTSAPFRTAESLYRYSNLGMHLVREPPHAWADFMTRPTLILTGADDTIALPDESEELARRIPHARLVTVPECDHFSLHQRGAYVQHVVDFIERTERAAVNGGEWTVQALEGA